MLLFFARGFEVCVRSAVRSSTLSYQCRMYGVACQTNGLSADRTASDVTESDEVMVLSQLQALEEEG